MVMASREGWFCFVSIVSIAVTVVSKKMRKQSQIIEKILATTSVQWELKSRTSEQISMIVRTPASQERNQESARMADEEAMA